jgi:hypothetical protein
MPMRLLRCAGALAAFSVASPALQAQVNDFGVGGVLDVPSARMEAENTFTATYSRKDVADIYAIAYQPFPRLETSFRYTLFNIRPKPGTQEGTKDRSFEVKYRLLDESEYMPQVTVGIRDLLGTGVWSAEYLVANKRVGSLDVSVGMGWGRLADRTVMSNPLSQISRTFDTREGFSGLGGEFSLKSFFRGPRVGAFGSLRYSIESAKVDVLASYSSDRYFYEQSLGLKDADEALSFGLEWEATPGVRLALSRQQGGIAFKLSAALDTGVSSPRKPPNGFGAWGRAAPAQKVEPAQGWFPRMAGDAEASGVLLRSMQFDDDGVLRLRYSNMTYQVEADAIDRVMHLVDQYAPRSVQSVELTGDSLGLPTHTVRIARSYGERDLAGLLPPAIAIDRPVEIAQPSETRAFRYPNGAVGAGLVARTYLFDPDAPFLYQVSLNLTGVADLGGGWNVEGTWVQNLSSQFGRIQRDGDSLLPPVRTDLKRYLQEGKSGIDRLVVVKRGKIGRDLYYQTFGGILEEMYSGVGGEVLWRRADLPFAFGANVMAVRQREYDKLFGLRKYQTVTGHVSAYWATGFHNFDVAVHAGRYLAKDVGATLEIQKRFANGWSVGAFATLTDVPFDVFGEGSFDKGLIFRLPFDLYGPRNTQGGYRTILRSINRDGGRMIDNWPGALWESMRRTHGDMLDRNQDRMVSE